MAYQYLTAAEQAAIVDEVRASIPTPEQVEWDREAAHYRTVVRALAGLGEMPDAYVPSDTSDLAAIHAALDGIEA